MKNIDNAATNKISPFKKLTTEQEQLVNDIISFTKHHLTQNHPAIYTVYGDAGTGKSVSYHNYSSAFKKKHGHNKIPFFIIPIIIFLLTIRKF